eukprot:118375_1
MELINTRITLENNIELEQLRKFIVEIKTYDDIINANKDFSYNVSLNKVRQIPYNGNASNCLQCNFTCHKPCPRTDADKARCDAMDDKGYCRMCPDHCHWSIHKNVPYIVESYQETETNIVQELKDKYDNALKKKRSTQQLMKPLLTDFMKIEQKLDTIIQNIYVCMNELTVLKPN